MGTSLHCSTEQDTKTKTVFSRLQIVQFKMAVTAVQYTLENSTRKTKILLRIFIFLDLFILFSSIVNLVWLPYESSDTSLEQFKQSLTICVIGIFTASLSCNSLAFLGISTGKRGFLLPWLLFFLLVKIFLVFCFINNLLSHPFNVIQILLFLLILSMMSVWRQVQRQFILMRMPSLQEVTEDAEIASSRSIVSNNDTDLPPKYEDVEETPPKYHEAILKFNVNDK